MMLNETVLHELAEWRPAGGRQTLNLSDKASGWALAITADRNDELGCLAWELSFQRSGKAPAGHDLAGWAQRVADRVTGLLEPLKVVEVDCLRREALLRSNEPAQRQDRILYYEVLLKNNNQATVHRYKGFPLSTGRREQVAFALTHEALAKLAADLTADQ
jgi:hypothetical protein